MLGYFAVTGPLSHIDCHWLVDRPHVQACARLIDTLACTVAVRYVVADEHRQNYVDVVQGEEDREDLLSLVSGMRRVHSESTHA